MPIDLPDWEELEDRVLETGVLEPKGFPETEDELEEEAKGLLDEAGEDETGDGEANGFPDEGEEANGFPNEEGVANGLPDEEEDEEENEEEAKGLPDAPCCLISSLSLSLSL